MNAGPRVKIFRGGSASELRARSILVLEICERKAGGTRARGPTPLQTDAALLL